ncbi:hypothetical protein L210DRAFT_949581 [Boletus edulis BED1]|uniref:Uncharacterized protein n=1 Tax=Boletus edulis BED1 TaxID=1328754 RepID=A0AAD4BAY9_BOLED|nr:hypothetical protein L210DRAFT_949581 [Boletus edulis BED1]
MTGPEPGRYYIRLVASQQLVGADPPYYGDLIPIITEGIADIWDVEKSEYGTYTLTIVRGTPVYTKGRDGRVVGTLNPPGSTWSIQSLENGSYTICAVGGRVPPPFCWTVSRTDRTFVSLLPLKFQENQQWNFIPV